MRIPYPGRLKELVERHKLFEESGSKVHRPSAGRSTLYAAPKPAAMEPVRGVFERMIVLRRDSGQRASLVSTLSVMTALRGAILKHSPQPPPEYISGHMPGSTRDAPVRSEAPHIALAPLPFVSAPHATGDLMGAAVLLPNTLTREEREICWRAVEAVEKLEMPWGWWDVSVTDAEEKRSGVAAADMERGAHRVVDGDAFRIRPLPEGSVRRGSGANSARSDDASGTARAL